MQHEIFANPAAFTSAPLLSYVRKQNNINKMATKSTARKAATKSASPQIDDNTKSALHELFVTSLKTSIGLKSI